MSAPRYAARIRDLPDPGRIESGFTLAFEGGPLAPHCRLHLADSERPNDTFRYLVVMRWDAEKRTFTGEGYSLDAADWDDGLPLCMQRETLRAILGDPSFVGFLLGMYRYSPEDECMVWMPNPPLADLI